jgi:ATP-binding cassette subfamily C (CFTR/MRP) protein 1
MESVSRSPIYTHFGETLTGATTIRAYDRIGDFVTENEGRIDRNQLCYYPRFVLAKAQIQCVRLLIYSPSFVASRWLSVRLEFVGNIIIAAASLLAVLGRGSIGWLWWWRCWCW